MIPVGGRSGERLGEHPILSAVGAVGAVLVAILVIGLATIGHQGISTDEPWQIDMARPLYDRVVHGTPMTGEHRYYGTAFTVASEAVFQLQRAARNAAGASGAADTAGLSPDYARYLERIRVKQPLTFLVTILAYLSVAGLAGVLCGARWAWLGPVVLALMPRFWGHSFFNPKDTPFAVGFTVATFVAVFTIERLLRDHESRRVGLREKLAAGAALGVLVGLASAVRIGGAAILVFFPLVYALVAALPFGGACWRGHDSQYWRNRIASFAVGYGALCLTWWVTVTLLHPAAWSDPVRWPFRAAAYLSSHPWPGQLLFEGRYGPPEVHPWYYLPKYFLLTVPSVFLVAFAAGLGLFLWQFPRLSVRQRAAGLLVAMQVFFVPAVGVVTGATTYDGMRQFLFVLPGIAVLAAAAIAWIFDSLRSRRARVAGAVVLAAAAAIVVRDMVQLHPYQYVYFNRASGGLRGAVDRYELDYWALSFREATEWLNQHARQPVTVIVAGNLHSAALFARPGITMVHYQSELAEEARTGPFYFLALYKHGYAALHPECGVVHRVERQRIALSLIRSCPNVAHGEAEQ